jgi:hypothetical protein
MAAGDTIMEDSRIHLILLMKESLQNMLKVFEKGMQSTNFSAVFSAKVSVEAAEELIAKHSLMLDSLGRDIKIAISRIKKFEKTEDWSLEACNQIIEDLRLKNIDIECKTNALREIFATGE